MTPEQLTTNVTVWAGVLVTVSGIVAGAAAVILPRLAALTAQVEQLFELHEENKAKIESASTPAIPVSPTVNPIDHEQTK